MEEPYTTSLYSYNDSSGVETPEIRDCDEEAKSNINRRITDLGSFEWKSTTLTQNRNNSENNVVNTIEQLDDIESVYEAYEMDFGQQPVTTVWTSLCNHSNYHLQAEDMVFGWNSSDLNGSNIWNIGHSPIVSYLRDTRNVKGYTNALVLENEEKYRNGEITDMTTYIHSSVSSYSFRGKR